MRPDVLLSHPLIMTVNVLSMTKQAPPPSSLLDSLLETMLIGPFSDDAPSIVEVARPETEVSPDQDRAGSALLVSSGGVDPESPGDSETADSGPPEGSVIADTGSPESPGLSEGGFGDHRELFGSEKSLVVS